MLQYNNSVLPKLLAKENITIKHGNYPTAWFNIKDRELGLPLWKDMGKDVYDLLIGHEVGHALETPYEGWHDSPEKLDGCPRSYINVIEDARIERKIQSRYAGLVGPMSRGYLQLLNNDFFGDVKNIDWDQTKLIDKINLKAKLRELIEVPFNDEEVVFYKRACNTDTFADVVQLVRDIYDYTKENQKELLQQPEVTETNNNSGDEDNEENMSMGHDDMESNNEEQEENNQPVPGNESNEGDAEEESNKRNTSSDKPEHSQDVSITDEIFRSKEKTLVDQLSDGSQPMIVQESDKAVLKSSIISYKALAKDREENILRTQKSVKDDETRYWELRSLEKMAIADQEYAGYMKDVKKNVSNAIKEFEQKKAATRWARATSAKTGNLDVNKIWSYKTNDDIFLRQTNLADAKDHGMIMIIDFSGSMAGSMKYVIDQVMHTIMFCKGVNIPFEVYAFTTEGWRHTNTNRFGNLPQGHMHMDDLSMPLLVSSELSKSEFETATRHLYYRINYESRGYDSYRSRFEDWGSTPLNQALVVSHELVKNFINKHKVEKMNFITFTDGDANGVHTVGRWSDPNVKVNSWDIRMLVQGKVIKCVNGRKDMTTKLLENLSKRYNTNNIGFFMADSAGDWRWKLNDIWSDNALYKEVKDLDQFKKDSATEYRKNKCVEFTNLWGYNTYYMVKGGQHLQTEGDDFEINADATDAQIRNAFKKFAKSKKTNKVLMNKFGAAVA
tara:strand:+ start:21057 stop:23240 length:2184 start_codon:yes stop_codon:yes gene_type:complete